MKLRKEVRRDFNREKRTGKSKNVERIKTTQRKYNEAIREAKKSGRDSVSTLRAYLTLSNFKI